MTRYHIGWAGHGGIGYEVSSRGDKRFSAFNARMPDGRSIEEWYQCDIKGYDIGGTNWRAGKGKSPVFPYPADHLWQMYLALWRIWTINNGELIVELQKHASEHNNTLVDNFAPNTPNSINQARALATILNEWILDNV